MFKIITDMAILSISRGRVCHFQDVDGYRWAFATNFKPCPQATE